MKKQIYVLLIVIFCLPMGLFADNLDSFSYEQLRQYNSSKLSLDIQSKTTGSISNSGSFYASNSKKWIPYEGTRKISDSLLFELAQYDQEAINTRKYEKAKNVLIWGGIATTVAGCIVMLANDNDTSIGFTTGLVTASVGSVALSGGLGMSMFNRYPSNIANMAIQEYNKKLQENILKSK
jgi:hypothetical protein